jgi:CheY-like chemotaxis protein
LASITPPPRPIILLIEDEPLQQIFLSDLIAEAGFEVIEVGSAEQGLAVLESRSDVRIVFADLDMPQSIDGLRIAAAIRDRWPPIEIILTSGRTSPAMEMIPARSCFVVKLYVTSQIIGAIQSFAADSARDAVELA